MLEIDDRYPEFAEPYEPVKGGKHHKAMDISIMPLLIIGALTAFSVIRPNPPEKEIVPEPSPSSPAVFAVLPAPQPNLIPTPESTPEPTPEPLAIPAPVNQVPIVYVPEPTPEQYYEAAAEEYYEPEPEPEEPVEETEPAPEPDVSSEPILTPEPSSTPEPTSTPEPSSAPEPTSTPAETAVPEHIEPVLDDAFAESVLGESGSKKVYPYFGIKKLNDLKGGHAKITIYYLNEDGVFVPCENPEATVEYTGEDTDDYYAPEFYGEVTYPGAEEPTFTMKIVVEATYPDGTAGTFETNTFPVHTASFMGFYTDLNDGVPVLIYFEDKTITFEMYADDAKINPSDIEQAYTYIGMSKTTVTDGVEDTQYYYAEPEWFTGDDGKLHVRTTFNLSGDTEFVKESDILKFETFFEGKDENGYAWTCQPSYTYTVN